MADPMKMMTKGSGMKTLLLAGIVVLVGAPALAQTNPRYIRFAGVPSAVKGALFTPDAPQKPPHVGILVMHRASNFYKHPRLRRIVPARFSGSMHEPAFG